MNWKKYSSLLLFILVFLLPIVVFSVYEIGSLRNNEEVIESIYNNQLDAILYSVNQYSEDVLSDWADNISHTPASDKTELSDKLNSLPALIAMARFNKDLNEVFRYIRSDTFDLDLDIMQNQLAQKDSVLKRLDTYLRGNYRKITALESKTNSYQYFLYALEQDEKVFYDVLIITPEKFISEVLDPKIQEIAQDKFYIGAIRSATNERIYINDKEYGGSGNHFTKTFWLLPEYALSIELRDTTIGELIRSRSRKDLMVILIVDFVLIIGLILVFRNVQRQTKLSRLKTDFVSNVSHEIRTPLALISMYIESLEMGRVKSKEKIHEYYAIILQETHRLTSIVNKILSFSQIENEKRRYSFSPANINDIVERSVSTFRFNLEQKGFTFEVSAEDDLPTINMDSEAVADALINLIDNAIKYSADNKEITIRTGKRDNWIYAEVRDKGIGISTEDQQYIFDKFFRVSEKNLALKAKGSGLGLTILKHIIDAHKGRIELESERGKGSVFRLLFPIN